MALHDESREKIGGSRNEGLAGGANRRCLPPPRHRCQRHHRRRRSLDRGRAGAASQDGGVMHLSSLRKRIPLVVPVKAGGPILRGGCFIEPSPITSLTTGIRSYGGPSFAWATNYPPFHLHTTAFICRV